jgi:phenylacetyl-CoA:acceptor oxidoreductase subunit 1
MVYNLVKCIGCGGCVASCIQANFLPPDLQFRRLLVKEYKPPSKGGRAAKIWIPVQCNHCNDPRCVEACPTGATYQREDGIVYIDQDLCIGCRYCMMACPYQARGYLEELTEWFPGQGFTEWEKMREKMNPLQTKTVHKCHFCVERIDEGLKKGLTPGVDREATPACVNGCPTKTMYFGDLDDPESDVSRLIAGYKAVPLHEEWGTEPSIYYIEG